MVLQVLSYSRSAESFAGDPANTLEGENRVESIREAFVLSDALVRMGNGKVNDVP